MYLCYKSVIMMERRKPFVLLYGYASIPTTFYMSFSVPSRFYECWRQKSNEKESTGTSERPWDSWSSVIAAGVAWASMNEQRCAGCLRTHLREHALTHARTRSHTQPVGVDHLLLLNISSRQYFIQTYIILKVFKCNRIHCLQPQNVEKSQNQPKEYTYSP